MIVSLVKEKPVNYQTNTDYDGLWKKIISELFEEFILFVAPDLYEAIEFNRKPEFLQQEFFKQIIEEKKGKQVADQIVKVHLKNGEDKWILIHIEIQGSPGSSFAKRMFQYFYKIYDYHEKEVFAIALITDSNVTPQTNAYHYSFFGTKLIYEFNTIAIAEHTIEELEKSNNPFSLAILAGKYVSETKKDFEKRYQYKRKLIQVILERMKYPEEQSQVYISALIYFVDYLLQMPKELTEKLQADLIPIMEKEVVEMDYIETFKSAPTIAGVLDKIKEKGIQEGREEGRREGMKEVARKLLSKGMEISEISELTELSEEEIKKLY